MKVKELIFELQKHDPEAEVLTEGCDCLGDVGEVEEFPSDKGETAILLTRSR